MTSPVASELPDFIAFWSIKSTTLTTTTFVKSGSDQTLIFDVWKSTLLKWCMCFFSMTILFVQHISVSIWKMFRSNAQRKLLSNFIPEWKRPVLTLFIGWFGDMTSWNDKTTRKWMVSLQIITIKSIDNNDCWFVTLDPSLSRTRKHPPSMRMKICEYSICKL